MSTKTLTQIQYESTRLQSLLKALHHSLPDDILGCAVDTRFLVGWAADLAGQLTEDIDALELSLLISDQDEARGTHG